MKPKNYVFKLIKSLDRNEKGYFKKFVALTGKQDNNYVRLFDAIDSQEQYDEKALKAKFKGEVFIKQLHVTKSYLYETILNALANYYKDRNGKTQIHQILAQVEVLNIKGLKDQSLAIIEKGKAISGRHDNFGAELLLLWYEQNICRENFFSNEQLEKLDDEIAEALDHYDAATFSFQLDHRIDLLEMKYGDQFPVQQKQELKMLLQDKKNFQAAKNSGKFMLRVKYLDVMGSYYKRVERNMAEAIKLTYQTLQLYEQYPWQIKERPQNYCSMFAGLSSDYYHTGEYEMAYKTVEKWRNALETYKKQMNGSDYRVHSIHCACAQVIMLSRLKRFKELLSVANKYEQEVAAAKDVDMEHMSKVFQLMRLEALIYEKHTDKALEMLTGMRQELRNEMMADIAYYVRIYEMLIHYQLNNLKLLPHLMVSLKRWVKGKYFRNDEFTLLIKMLGALIKTHSKPVENHAVLEKYHKKFDELFKRNKNTFPLIDRSVDILYWIKWMMKES